MKLIAQFLLPYLHNYLCWFLCSLANLLILKEVK